MKKILIGTHNQGKFREIAYLLSKKYDKISPISLKIKSPKEIGKSFNENSKLKANFFSRFVKFPVISDDSGLCIKALKNEHDKIQDLAKNQDLEVQQKNLEDNRFESINDNNDALEKMDYEILIMKEQKDSLGNFNFFKNF